MKVGIKRLDHARDLALPHYATKGAAGLDLLAAIDEEIELLPGQRMAVPTGIAIELPQDWEAQVRPRSGLALKNGITCLNSPGTIDADYRGEVAVLLVNHGTSPFPLTRGERIAQFLLAAVPAREWRLENDAAALGDTQRGGGGYGSTGRS